ncbi:unnamed protein product [Adineta steineri]|uniref:Uncharacterized protein n=1 Tax=Adineta steineri TaxID=433720 RepID=A0A813WBW5_9BILA|nr:unnamed protein product [Adineta steineri]CAF4061227.1 unnamed protein product [Adineta steineri]
MTERNMQFTRISANSYRPRITRVRPSDVPSTYRSSNNSNPAFASLQHRPLQPRQQVSLPAPLQPRRLVQHQQQVQHHLLQPRQQVLHQAVRLRQQVPQPVRPRRQVLQHQVLHHLRVQHQRQRQQQVLQPQHRRQQQQQQQRQQVSFLRDNYSFALNVISLSIAPSCGSVSSPPGQILTLTVSSATTTYHRYNYSFTANDLSSTLSFIATGDAGGPADHYWLLDQVSVNDMNSSTNVLINGDFETGNLNGWSQFCNTDANCKTTQYAHTVSSPCYAGTYCVYDACQNFDYLYQSFSTVVGHYYLISYYLRGGGTGGSEKIFVTLT